MNGVMGSADTSRILTREIIRAKLAAGRPVRPRSDADTTARLLELGRSRPYDPATDGSMGIAPAINQVAERIPAAVLVPLVSHASGFTVILTQRTSELKAHAGQIAFPGGRMEASDANAEAAALREAEEEIGLARGKVEILGRLDPYRTVTGFDVMPVVGAVTPPLALRPDPTEVADIFEVPLVFFLDAANHQRHTRTLTSGATRAYYAMPYGDRYIWGATAGMLLNLYEVLTA
jgi:8-oxo-dGTP pyrophosphatase MutT (NUDIX family)